MCVVARFQVLSMPANVTNRGIWMLNARHAGTEAQMRGREVCREGRTEHDAHVEKRKG